MKLKSHQPNCWSGIQNALEVQPEWVVSRGTLVLPKVRTICLHSFVASSTHTVKTSVVSKITWYFLDQPNIVNKWRLYNNISVRSFQDFASNRLSVLSDKDLTSAHWRPDISLRKGAYSCLWSRFASFLYRVPVNRLLGAAVSVDPWHARLQILHRVLPKQTGADKWSGCVGSGWTSSGRNIDKQQRPQPLQRIQPRR